MKYFQSFLAVVLFLGVLLCTYYVHVRFFKVNVVMYSAVLDAFLATGITALLLFMLPFLRTFSSLEKAQLTAIWLLVGYALAISVPTVIDRSLSFYILEKIQQRGGGIRLDRMEDVFTREYLKEHRLVDVRLTEQLESGTITIQNGCVKLTERGQRFTHFSRFFRQNFLPKQRLLMGEYSDALTDPFRDSRSSMGYECE
jgi:hypothetical protein